MFSWGQEEEEELFNRETEVKVGGEAMHRMVPDLELSNKLGWDFQVPSLGPMLGMWPNETCKEQ